MNRYLLTKAGINPNEGIHRLGGKIEIYEKLLNNFLEDEHYGQLIDAIEKKDVEAAFQASHALKGITGNLSMNDLYEALVPLVEDFRAGSMEHVDEFLPAVKEKYNLIVEALSK